MSREQHGRKPQKAWHKRLTKKHAKTLLRWPDSPTGVPYDGAPTPLKQKSHKPSERKAMPS